MFPDKINTFVDLFGGAFNVGINVKAEHIIYNDIINYLSELFEYWSDTDIEEINAYIDKTIAENNLSPTNADTFLAFREKYNKTKDIRDLFILVCYSFNYQMRFNNNHQYNSSFGKNRSYFSDRQREDLYAMKKNISTDVVFSSKSFVDIDYSDFDEHDLLYFDPPYFASVGNYNDGKRGFEGWTEEHEKKLLELLDKLDEQGTRWALSNNLKYDNPFLDEWKDKYKIHYLNGDYVNCNYHKIDRSKDVEVLITNY